MSKDKDRYTEDEIKSVQEEYWRGTVFADTPEEERPYWRDVAERFKERFGRLLRYEQVKYLKTNYAFRGGQRGHYNANPDKIAKAKKTIAAKKARKAEEEKAKKAEAEKAEQAEKAKEDEAAEAIDNDDVEYGAAYSEASTYGQASPYGQTSTYGQASTYGEASADIGLYEEAFARIRETGAAALPAVREQQSIQESINARRFQQAPVQGAFNQRTTARNAPAQAAPSQGLFGPFFQAPAQTGVAPGQAVPAMGYRYPVQHAPIPGGLQNESRLSHLSRSEELNAPGWLDRAAAQAAASVTAGWAQALAHVPMGYGANPTPPPGAGQRLLPSEQGYTDRTTYPSSPLFGAGAGQNGAEPTVDPWELAAPGAGFTNGGSINGGFTNGGFTNGGFTNAGSINGGFINTGFINTGFINAPVQPLPATSNSQDPPIHPWILAITAEQEAELATGRADFVIKMARDRAAAREAQEAIGDAEESSDRRRAVPTQPTNSEGEAGSAHLSEEPGSESEGGDRDGEGEGDWEGEEDGEGEEDSEDGEYEEEWDGEQDGEGETDVEGEDEEWGAPI